MPAPAAVARLRRANARIADMAISDLGQYVRSLNVSRPEAARNALLEFTPALVDQYGTLSAATSAEWYDELRATSGARGTFRARPAPLVPAEAIAVSVRAFAGHLWTDNPMGVLAPLEGTVQRGSLLPGWDTITGSTNRDPQASGWHRVARAGGCDFCVMLAQRGAVYKKATADFAAHPNCNCGAAPSWDPSAPEVEAKAYEASRRLESVRFRAANGDRGAQRQLDAHRENVRSWISDNQGALDHYRAEAGA